MFKAILSLAGLLFFMTWTSPAPADASTRPLSLNIATDCGAIADDGIDDTATIRACIDLHPRELFIPIGVFEVNTTASNQAAALSIKMSDTVVRGEGPASVIKLIRPANGVTGSRVFAVHASNLVDVERVTFRDFTIDGGRTLTCQEAKHTPGTSDGQGQQQHGIMLIGQGAYTRDVLIKDMNFTRISGDAIFVYQGVEDFRLEGQTVGGWCRAGIAMNAYANPALTTCDDPSAEGMRRITLSRNTFIADPTASQGARGIDIEPNAPICDIFLLNNITDEIEIGATRRIRVEGNTITQVGDQIGGSIALVSSTDYSVRNNILRGGDAVTPPIYIRKSHVGIVEGNTIYQPYPVEGISVSNNGSYPSSDATIIRNRVEYTGTVDANSYAIRTQGIIGSLTIADNTIVGLWKYGVHIFGGGEVLVDGNLWTVSVTGLVVRSSGTGLLKTSNVKVSNNRGTAGTLYLMNNLVDSFWDCSNTSTGTRSNGANIPLACSAAEASQSLINDDIEARMQALEGGS